jgi:type II secretory pathway predicted ATPase ExeA
MDYESFYNFEVEPFSNVPDPKFFYNGPEHVKPFLRIMYSAKRMKGLVVLIGMVGAGKTTLSRKILSALLQDKEYLPGMLILTRDEYPPFWLTSKVAQLLQIEMDEDDSNKLQLIAQRLFEIKKEGRKPVIIIDEANKLNNDANLEELRSILNIEDEERRLITFILSGMPSLKVNLSKNESLTQRIAYLVTLTALSRSSTEDYVRYRLKIAGAQEEIFTPDAFDEIFKWCKGRPRLINSICDNSLLEGVFLQKKPIAGEIVELAAESLGLKSETEIN